MTEDKTYNGWKNHATWNVALWIGNHEGIYYTARHCRDYAHFLNMATGEGCRAGLFGCKTPDGVAWNDSGLDIEALDEMIKEL